MRARAVSGTTLRVRRYGPGQWTLNKLQKPAGCHLAVTLPSATEADAFVQAVKDAVRLMREVRGGPFLVCLCWPFLAVPWWSVPIERLSLSRV
jgi:hypothetical protein